MKKISLKHLIYLTDDFGIWQHTKICKIDRSKGYALDDSARALLVALSYGNFNIAQVYLDFIYFAVGKDKMVNFFSEKRKPLPIECSEDALGETYWALAEAVKKKFNTAKAGKLIKKITPFVYQMNSTRGKAYSLLGAYKVDKALANQLITSLAHRYQNNSEQNWLWIEDEMTYANAIIPFSFLCASDFFGKNYQEVGLLMLDFLNSVTSYKSRPIVIGSLGWYRKGGKKALFNQQPIDAAYQILANEKAWEISGDEKYLNKVKLYLSWFWGNNISGLSLMDGSGDSCLDGIWERGLNPNRGAENIVCYLLAQKAIARHFDFLM